MKHTKVEGRVFQGFTLVEMLVVIAIIAILAAMILPTLSAAKKHAQIAKAQLEMTSLLSAIRDYETDNSVYPVSKAALSSSATNNSDFTFGTYNVQCAPVGGTVWNDLNAGFTSPPPTPNTPSSCQVWGQTITQNTTTPPSGYQANNSEVIAILMDLEKFGNGTNTVNAGHVRNPKRTPYLQAHFSNDTRTSGVGLDGVYRDPWGNPYIITMDLNGDNKARDAFYLGDKVSADLADPATPKRGLNGLMPTVVNNTTYYEANLPVMVWSAGPDRMIDPEYTKANAGVNKDNVLSWKQ